MNLLFSMSLAGSLIFILYLIIRPVAKRYLPVSWRYGLLKVSLLFYLLPYQYYKYRYTRIVRYLFPGSQQNAHSKPPDVNKIILIDSEGHIYFKNQTLIYAILGIWGTGAIIFLLYHIVKYIYCMRNLQQITKLSVTVPDEHCMTERHSKAKVSLCENQYITTPFTIGLFSPHIVLPVSLADREKSKMIIAHEMAHIRRHDNLIKCLWLFVVILHWYNPLIYVLYREICKVSEQVCDLSVIQNMSEQEKRQYQYLIIELGREKKGENTLLASTFSGGYKIIKERITVMDKKPVSSRKLRFVASLAIALVILALIPISVRAYSPWSTLSYLDEEFFLGNEILYELPKESDLYDPFQEYDTTHDIFVTDDGQVCILDTPDSQVAQATCQHDMRDGKIYIHTDYDDGSCTVYCYDCQCCILCDLSENRVYNSNWRFAKCAH